MFYSPHTNLRTRMPGNVQEKPVKFAGKRLESYKSSVKLFGSDNEFAITDGIEEDDDEESSAIFSRRPSKAGKFNYHKPKSYKSTLSKSFASQSSFYHSSDEEKFDSKLEPYTGDSNIHNQFQEDSDNRDESHSEFEDLSDFQTDSNNDEAARSSNNDKTNNNEDYDDEEDDDDDFESDSSNDSATIFLSNETKKQNLLKKVKPPRKLVIPAPQRLDLPPKITNLGKLKKADSSSEFSEISDSELNALEASIKRRPSIVDHALDERPVFPRSTVGDIKEEESSSSDESEYNDENLLAILSEDDSEVSDVSDTEDENEELYAYDDDDEADDDNAVEETEERAILEEVKRSGDLEGHKVGYVSDDDDFESDISFDQDAFFETRTTQAGIKSITSAPLTNQYSDEDDSYLWSYFFTSGDESEDENLKTNPTHVNSVDAGEPVEISGDSTDEDENLPRSNMQTFSRPTEILSTSANTSRPPVLGSWVMSSERPYGIIDGLTTRTLSTTSGTNGISNQSNFVGASSAATLTDVKRSLENSTISKINQDDGKSDSELSELALDDFIYTSELEDEDPMGDYPAEDPIYPNINKDIPLSAFRNRGVQFINRRNSTNNRSQEVHISSGQSMSKHFRKRRKHKHKHEEEEAHSYTAEDIDDLGATDLIDELVSIGAISPLFGGIA